MRYLKYKKLLFIPLVVVFYSCDIETPKLGKSSIDKVIAAMTLEEKATLVVGAGMENATGDATVIGTTRQLVLGAAGTTVPIPRLGIPAIVLADGPAGLRITPEREGESQTYYCTAFPVATALASSWNSALVEKVGEAMGNEVLEYGVDIILAPGMNLQRNPLCGRNFEYYSEDPLVTGKMAAAMVRGLQSNGVGTTIKHFAAYNQETNRMYSDSRLTQRALREIYLKGFEIAVKESLPLGVMSSYNSINGTSASHSKDLLTTILRNEWGFDGFVVSDWFGGKDGTAMIQAGNDLLMPGLPMHTKVIIKAVEEGNLDIAVLDNVVRNILNVIVELPRFKGYKYSNKPDLKSHAEIVRQAASEGMVLLENKDVLPFPNSLKNIAVYGVTSYEFIAGGSGSGDVNKAYSVSLIEGLTNAGYQLNKELKNRYEKHVFEENEKNRLDPEDRLAPYLPSVRPVEILIETEQLKQQAATSEIALITIGRNSGEFLDRKVKDDFELTQSEQTLIESICNVFHSAGKKVVVILNTGGVIEVASWKGKPDAILLAWQGGQECGNAVVDILSGKVNPSGKLTMTFPVKYMDVASSVNFPYDFVLSSPMEIALGRRGIEEADRIQNVDYTIYEEDIYVGYRFFDTLGKEVSYPFGYGLSYTNFEYSNVIIKDEPDNVYTVEVEIKNSGNVSGKEVVQLYISAPENPSHGKPKKELKAFSKTKELQPGESQKITMKVKALELASFDEKNSSWLTDSGIYKFHIGASSKDIYSTVEAIIKNEIRMKVNNVLLPQAPISVLKKNSDGN